MFVDLNSDCVSENRFSPTPGGAHPARELMTDCNVVGQTLTDHSLLEFIIKPHYFVQQNADMNMSSTSSNYNCIDNINR